MKSIVYFLQAEDGFIKIGFTIHYWRRVDTIKREEKKKHLTLLGYVDGGETRETELHHLFRDFKVIREWFRPEPMLLEFIKANCSFDIPAKRPRVMMKFWLDMNIAGESNLFTYLSELKDRKLFATAVKKALRVFRGLESKQPQYVFAEYPWLISYAQMHTSRQRFADCIIAMFGDDEPNTGEDARKRFAASISAYDDDDE